MTMPNERTRAVLQTKKFLRGLLNKDVSPKVPDYIREMALDLLRHYPMPHDLERASKKAPESFGDVEFQESVSYLQEIENLKPWFKMMQKLAPERAKMRKAYFDSFYKRAKKKTKKKATR